jgi:hypothetical protein
MAGIGISFLETYFPKNSEKFAKFLEINKYQISEALENINTESLDSFTNNINKIVSDNEYLLSEEERKSFTTNFSVEGLQKKINGIKEKVKSSSKEVTLKNDGVIVGNSQKDGSGKEMACIVYKVDGGKRKSNKSKKTKKTKNKSKKSNKTETKKTKSKKTKTAKNRTHKKKSKK